MSTDYYATLELEPSATDADIAAKFRVLAIKHHPKKNLSNMA